MSDEPAIAVVTVRGELGAACIERWYGPVEQWTALSPSCWHGTLVARGPAEFVLVQDVVGDAEQAELDELAEVLGSADVVVYVGDEGWSEAGVRWAADAGRLAAVVAGGQGEAPEGAVWVGPDALDADARVVGAIARTASEGLQARIGRVGELGYRVLSELEIVEVAPHLGSEALFALAVRAELSGDAEDWLYLAAALLEVLAAEGVGDRHDSRLEVADAVARLERMELHPDVVGSWKGLLELADQTDLHEPLMRWVEPALSEHPDAVLLGRFRAVVRRAPDLVEKYLRLNELEARLEAGEPVRARGPVYDFWRAVAAPFIWTNHHRSLPDLLSLAPEALRSARTVFIAGKSLRSGIRLGNLLAGLTALGGREVPGPEVPWPAIALQPKAVDLEQLEARDRAGRLTVLVDREEPAPWEGAFAGVQTVALTPELSVPTPGPAEMSARLPGWSPTMLGELVHLMHRVRYSAGGHLVEPDTAVGAIGWLHSGSAVLDGEYVLAPGDLVAGETLFVEPGWGAREVVATQDCEVDLLSRSALRSMVEHGRDAVRVLESAVCRALAARLGPAGAEAGGKRARQRALGAWKGRWEPLAKGHFHTVSARRVARDFPDARALVAEGGWIYGPDEPPDALYLVLEGMVTLANGRRESVLGRGSFVGRTGLEVGEGWGEVASCDGPVTLLALDADGARLWELKRRAWRQAMIRTLLARLA